jgi:outer membrane lipoprotein SlyB
MKKIFVLLLGSSMLLTSCYTTQMSGNPAAVSAGASVGGMLGSIIGDRAGGFHGSQFGALVGTVAGAAIGNAATTPQSSSSSSSSDDGYYNVDRTAQRRNYTQQYSTPVTNVEVVNIRFIDDNRNHCIDAEEECKLVFEVVNNGSTPAYNVTPIVEETSGLKHLTISPSTQIGYMPAGNRVRYTATLRADRRIKTSQADLRVYVTESNGGVSEVHEFSLPTQRK